MKWNGAYARMFVGPMTTLRSKESLADALAQVWGHPQVLAEVRELLTILPERVDHLHPPLGISDDVPLCVHARYSRAEILAAFGIGQGAKPDNWQAGVRWDAASQSDLFAFTLDKTAGSFSPTTRYRDYAINPTLIHWESQSATSVASDTGQRYLNHRAQKTNVVPVRSTPRQRPCVVVPRQGQLRLSRGRPTDRDHLGARASASRRPLRELRRSGRPHPPPPFPPFRFSFWIIGFSAPPPTPIVILCPAPRPGRRGDWWHCFVGGGPPRRNVEGGKSEGWGVKERGEDTAERGGWLLEGNGSVVARGPKNPVASRSRGRGGKRRGGGGPKSPRDSLRIGYRRCCSCSCNRPRSTRAKPISQYFTPDFASGRRILRQDAVVYRT